MIRLYFPVAIGVIIASLIIGAFAYVNIISRDYEDWRFVKTELVFNCMVAPTHTLMICERYSDWVLAKVKAHYLRACYDRYQKRQRATYPSMAVCTAIFKVSYNIWDSSSEVRCNEKEYC